MIGPMNITLATLHRFAVPCALLLAVGLVSEARAEEYLKSYAVSGRPDVRIHVDDSTVHVVTSDTQQVEFHVTAEGFSAINIGGKLHVDSHQDGNQVELTVRVEHGVTIGINTRRLSTEVRMPRNADLQLETSDGRVDVSDLNGNISVHTSDGGVKVSKLSGAIDISSKDGAIAARSLSGTIKLHSGDGRIDGIQLDGKCEASTKDGRINVDGRFDSLDIKSGDGSVTASAGPGSQMSSTWSIATSDGSVEVAIPKDLKANLDASTRDGHISLGLPVSVEGDLGKSKVRGTLNGGGPTLYIHTGDGSIHLGAS